MYMHIVYLYDRHYEFCIIAELSLSCLTADAGRAFVV